VHFAMNFAAAEFDGVAGINLGGLDARSWPVRTKHRDRWREYRIRLQSNFDSVRGAVRYLSSNSHAEPPESTNKGRVGPHWPLKDAHHLFHQASAARDFL